jgi:hypothetical protein
MMSLVNRSTMTCSAATRSTTWRAFGMTAASVALFCVALWGAAAITVPAFAAGDLNPSPPPPPASDAKPADAKPTDAKTDTKTDTKAPASTKHSRHIRKAKIRTSYVDDPAFLAGYHDAYATIYERNDYATAITQLKALGQDDRADVANLIGYSYRKLGDYKLSQVWYERALKADPNHVKTWQYYGMWQVEQGHPEQARVNLAKIEQICGLSCPEYRSLADAIDGKVSVAHAAY